MRIRDRELKMVGSPLTGAWIETRIHLCNLLVFRVAPRAGAWIETKSSAWSGLRCWVAPYEGVD